MPAERRMLLALVLSFTVVFVWGQATGKCTPPPRKPPAPKDGGTPEAPAPGVPEPPVTPPPGEAPPPPPPAPPAPVEAGPQKDHVPAEVRHVVRTPELEVLFTTRGGAIEAVRLRRAHDLDKTTPLDIVVPVDPAFLLGQVDDTYLEPGGGAPGPADREEDPAGPLRLFHWTRGETEKAEELETTELDVIYTFTTASGGVWKRQWVLPKDEKRYDVRSRLSYRPAEGEAETPRAVKMLVAAGLLREPSTGAAFQSPNRALVRMARQADLVEAPDGIPLLRHDEDPSELRLHGARTNFFLAAYYAPAEGQPPPIRNRWATGEAQDARQDMQKNLAAFFLEVRERDVRKDESLAARIRAGVAELHHAWLVVDVPQAEGTYVEVPLYVGPIDRYVLRQDEYAEVQHVVTYPAAPDLLADALLGIYDVALDIFGSVGLAVILMTLVVRGLMMPLSIRNQLSMRKYSRKIAKLKPKLDALKKKYGSNVKRMREEQAKLYREHGVGFPAGCLMLLIQLPIFFALFSSLRTEYSLRNAAFLWIEDLSGPDRLIDFGTTVLDLSILTIFSINILPLLMVGLSIWQQRMMPKPADEQQAQQMRMMKWMPIVFAVILYNYTAALSLYMVLSSVIAVIESRIVRWRDQDAAAAPESWPGAKGGAPA